MLNNTYVRIKFYDKKYTFNILFLIKIFTNCFDFFNINIKEF